MCMWFFQNPEIIFYYFLHILNLDIFLVLILLKSIRSRYLVPLTPPTVFGDPFEALRELLGWPEDMHVVFFQNPIIIFYYFFTHFELRHFLSSNITEVYREEVPCPLNSSHSFWSILLKLYMGF